MGKYAVVVVVYEWDESLLCPVDGVVPSLLDVLFMLFPGYPSYWAKCVIVVTAISVNPVICLS